MKNMIVTQYQMKRAERKKWLIATLVILLAFSALIGTFCATRPGTSAKAAENNSQIQLNQLFPKEAEHLDSYTFMYSDEETYQSGEHYSYVVKDVYRVPYSASLDIFNSLQEGKSFFTYKNVQYFYRGNQNDWTMTFDDVIPYKFSDKDDDYKTKFEIFVSKTNDYIYYSNNSLNISDIFGITPSVPLPEDPVAPEGYHFVGRYYDEAFMNPYKEGDVITADTNLYAKFEKDTYKVTYIVNGKQYVVSEVAYGDPINNTVPTGIDETNVFSGWFTDAACTQAFDFTQTASSDITLYSTIKLKMYDVKFFVNGELYATIQVPHGYTLVRLANSSETGAATAAALLASFEFDENAEVNADTEITEDKEVEGKLSKKAEKWINTGAWFDKNWQWLVATAAALVVIVIGSVLVAVYKKRG